MASKRLNLSVQYACDDELPQRPAIRTWVRRALDVDGPRGGQITIRFVDEDEGRTLNRDFRHKDYATNVLSFPYDDDPVVCGDLVVCTPVVRREAGEQGKSPKAHCAHLIVHGILHLQGYDHETGEDDAKAMEDKERVILAALGFGDPYAEEAAASPTRKRR
ncbi:rRNA maturation RNase YbeY [uncultured Propionivibrio sp.]|uniref:rRNA maturation RNase YbeY n=1 Tax=uncultured Propionivibrio sp. TaxID=426737 RepID=UPI0029BFB25D|nr:rRNA maturation RNase YbeY [uncultured Propionivibrio sp.]